MIKVWKTGEKARKVKPDYDPEAIIDRLYTPVKVKKKKGVIQQEFDSFIKDQETLNSYLKAFGIEKYPSETM